MRRMGNFIQRVEYMLALNENASEKEMIKINTSRYN